MFAALALACLIAPDDDYREPGPARPVPAKLMDADDEAFPFVVAAADLDTYRRMLRLNAEFDRAGDAEKVKAAVVGWVKAGRLLPVPRESRVEALGTVGDDEPPAMLVRIEDGKYAARLAYASVAHVYDLAGRRTYPLSKAEQRRALERRSSWARKSLALGRAAERSGSPTGAAVYYREALAYPDTPEAAEAARRIAAIEGQSHLPRGR